MFAPAINRTRAAAIPYNVEIAETKTTTRTRVLVGSVLTLPLLLAAYYLLSLSIRIGEQSTHDEAAKANVIIVMGAAEYSGRPSPILRARLDHVLRLYKGGFAPLVMTTGGPGGDPIFTEADVGRAYLMDRGVPSQAIVTQPQGGSTMYSISAAAEIMDRMGLKSCVLVSDGYHIFRAKRMLEARGIQVFGSPQMELKRQGRKEWPLYFRQAVAFALWKIGVTV